MQALLDKYSLSKHSVHSVAILMHYTHFGLQDSH